VASGKILEVKKGEDIMNSYEVAEILEVGKARNVILGQKPLGQIDATLGPGFQPEVNDTDESDD